MRGPILAVVAAIAAACGPVQGPKYAIKMPEQHAKLANGMRVFLLPDPTTDLVEVDVRYQVGSKEDPPGRAGLAHLVEHLMFDQRQAGPDKPPLGSVLRQNALYFNAFTNWDSTHYQTLARAEQLDLLVSLEAARLATGCETITEEQFAREREVVRNEIRQRLGRTDDQVLYKILEDVYPEGHPYRRMVGGDDTQISSATLAEACAFMRDYYVPERATLIIAGKVDDKTASASVDRWLAALPARAGAKLVEVPPVKPLHKKATYEMDVDENSVIVAWPLPPLHGPDADAASFILGNVFGRTAAFGSIYEFASDVEPIVLGGAVAPVMAVRVGLRGAGDVDEARGAVFRAAAGAGRYLENGDFFDEARQRLLGQLAMSFEPISSRAVQYGDYAQFDTEGKNFGGELERIKKLDANRLKFLAKSYLDPELATIIVIKAKKAAGGGYRRAAKTLGAPTDVSHDDLPVDRAEAAVPIEVPERSTLLARARRFELPNGMKVVLLHTESPLPVVTASLLFSVGQAHDPPGMTGLAEISAEELSPPMGSERMDYTSDVMRFDAFGRVGILWRSRVEPDVTAFEARGLAIHQDVLIKGLERMIKDSLYGQDAIEERQRLFSLALRRRSVQSERVVDKLLAESLYGPEHPYGRTAVATAASKGKIGSDETRSFARTHYSAGNATLILAGAVDEAKAERDIKASFGAWSRGHVDAPVTAPVASAGHVSVGVVGPDSPQIVTHLAYPTPAGIDAGYAARLVAVEMLRRRVGAIREKLGISYGVRVRYQPRVGPGMIEIGGGIDADRGGEALVALRGILDELLRGEGFVEDFVRARRIVLERYLVNANDSGTLAARLSEIAVFGLPPSFADDLVKQIARLTPRDVLALLNRELDPRKEVLVVEGTKSSVAKALAGAGLEGAKIVETGK